MRIAGAEVEAAKEERWRIEEKTNGPNADFTFFEDAVV